MPGPCVHRRITIRATNLARGGGTQSGYNPGSRMLSRIGSRFVARRRLDTGLSRGEPVAYERPEGTETVFDARLPGMAATPGADGTGFRCDLPDGHGDHRARVPAPLCHACWCHGRRRRRWRCGIPLAGRYPIVASAYPGASLQRLAIAVMVMPPRGFCTTVTVQRCGCAASYTAEAICAASASQNTPSSRKLQK